jgi:hypothetical protein
VKTYGLRNVFEGFQETIRFSSGRKVIDKPQGILSSMRYKNPLVFQRFPMFPLQIQGAAGKGSSANRFTHEVQIVKTSGLRNVAGRNSRVGREDWNDAASCSQRNAPGRRGEGEGRSAFAHSIAVINISWDFSQSKGSVDERCHVDWEGWIL